MRRVIAVVPLLVLLAGCSSGGDGSTSAGSKSAATADRAVGAPVAGTAAEPVQQTSAVQLPRSLVRTAQLQVQVGNVKTAAAAAERVVLGAGGQVADEQLDLQASHPEASLHVQVPPARVSAVLDSLSALGDELSRRLGTDDVTDAVVDLDSRVASQRASVERVRALLDRATGLGDVVRLEGELSRRESDLESLQARQRALSGQVAMADVTVELSTSRRKPVVTAAAPAGFRDGLRGGWRAFSTSARIVAATVGAVLPFLPILAAGGWFALRLRRRTAAA